MTNSSSNSVLLPAIGFLLSIAGAVWYYFSPQYDYVGKYDNEGFAVVRKGTLYGYINEAKKLSSLKI